MGTSNSNPGPSGPTPLVPSWADEDAFPVPPDAPNISANATPVAGSPTRFKAPRTNFTKFVTSGGTNRDALKRAIAGYIAGGTAGSANAARRMGASRRAAQALFSLLQAPTAGAADVLERRFEFERFRDKDISELLLALTDALPSEGSVDAGIARDAMTETAAWAADQEIGTIEKLSAEEMRELFIQFITFTIMRKLENEIGNSTVCLSPELEDIEHTERELRDFVEGAVRDTAPSMEEKISAAELNEVITGVYEAAFGLLEESAQGKGDEDEE